MGKTTYIYNLYFYMGFNEPQVDGLDTINLNLLLEIFRQFFFDFRSQSIK